MCTPLNHSHDIIEINLIPIGDGNGVNRVRDKRMYSLIEINLIPIGDGNLNRRISKQSPKSIEINLIPIGDGNPRGFTLNNVLKD